MLKYLFILKRYVSVNIIVNWIISCLMFYLVKDLTRRFRNTSVWVVTSLETQGFSYSEIFLQDFSTLNAFFLTKEYIQGLIFHSWEFSVYFCWKFQSERVDNYILCILCRHMFHKEEKKPMKVPQGLQLKLTLHEYFEMHLPEKATGLNAGVVGREWGLEGIMITYPLLFFSLEFKVY